ncbi:SDR family NAD(P)-dependent oxidoreductase [Homoserinibacter sp. YIM 151385]|uniref:SDR family NAD(P)-dependent oxidoreductase n=1 Tax=Homoserinibacter sp. YIM 151385 TaxID=2985506 RepID=UPI0022F112A6|nr:SDR family NAD(P)-dependent oxidoreductase [Homoserinibacter sp. YIM 151385]WBU36906.1 SDR family NAD(P)-dependent oxidoreductase [Homoserinibacter sp. YIM 151385]
MNELILVSGASTGIGAATARALATRGFHVLAGVRRDDDAEAISAEGIEPIRLDVTDPADVAALRARVDADPHSRPLRAIINNAAIEINAPVEVLPLEIWRRQFEVNLFGHIAVTQSLLPALRKSRGRIVNISSVGAQIALPIYGAYAGTKAAFEAASDALRREVAAQGIEVVIVRSGGVRTPMAAESGPLSLRLAEQMSAEHSHLYGDLISATVAFQARFLDRAITAERAARRIAQVAIAKRPRTTYTLGPDAALTLPLNRLLPTRLMDRILTPRNPKGPTP